MIPEQLVRIRASGYTAAMSRLELSPTVLTVPSFSASECCRDLEAGHILYFAKSPVLLCSDDLSFLLNQRQSAAGFRKNIAYRPLEDRVTGIAGSDREAARLREILRGYSRSVTSFLERLLAPYAATWKLDYASFRPIQEKGRNLKQKRRNDLLHVDSFPTRPTHGDRILRFFSNINPDEDRHWIVGKPFADSIKSWVAGGFELPSRVEPFHRALERKLKSLASRCGLPIAAHSRYDLSMLELHDFLKANSDYQSFSAREHWHFPPGSSWIVFTDLVPHAALSGRFALEQTFIINRSSLLLPEKAPLNVLERLSGCRLTG